MTLTEEKHQREHKFHQYLRNKLRDIAHLQRIESTTGAGIPDLMGCSLGRYAWIELKVMLKQGVLLRREQYAWGLRHAKYQGRCLIVAENGDLIYVWKFPNVSVEPYQKKYAKIVNDPAYTISKREISAVKLAAILFTI